MHFCLVLKLKTCNFVTKEKKFVCAVQSIHKIRDNCKHYFCPLLFVIIRQIEFFIIAGVGAKMDRIVENIWKRDGFKCI